MGVLDDYDNIFPNGFVYKPWQSCLFVVSLQDVIIFFDVIKISSLDTILKSPCYLLFNKMNKL